MAEALKCEKWRHEMETRQHCNQPMHCKRVGGEAKPVWHMGVGCAVRDVPTHCGVPLHEAS